MYHYTCIGIIIIIIVQVQTATEEFVDFITKPSTQIKAPSFDFTKPRLVQITVNDVGACMPLVALVTNTTTCTHTCTCTCDIYTIIIIVLFSHSQQPLTAARKVTDPWHLNIYTCT